MCGVHGVLLGWTSPHTKPEASWGVGMSNAESKAQCGRCLPANGVLQSTVTSMLREKHWLLKSVVCWGQFLKASGKTFKEKPGWMGKQMTSVLIVWQGMDKSQWETSGGGRRREIMQEWKKKKICSLSNIYRRTRNWQTKLIPFLIRRNDTDSQNG